MRILFGESPQFWIGQLQGSQNDLNILSPFGQFYTGQMADYDFVDIPYEITVGSSNTESGLIPMGYFTRHLSVSTGPIKLSFPTHSYWVNGEIANAKTVFSLDSSKSDSNPPYFNLLRITKEGEHPVLLKWVN
ncbi:MAG: hypothetical protein IPN59_09310 [Holophaga sp.]|nr:hypothetical protein [Holophaga sp.]